MNKKKSLQTKNCIFIGGKQIGVNCLNNLLKIGIVPQIVIANTDDTGLDTWHESLVKTSIANKLEIYQNTKINDPNILKRIGNISPEIIFCIGSTQLIPRNIVNLAKLGCLNIHPSLLPKYRGRYSIPHALFNDEKYTGVTLHWIDNGIDSGPIIKQKKILITVSDTAGTLYNKFTETGTKLFKDFISQWLSGKKIYSQPQDESQATYFPKELPNQGIIDWEWDGKKIFNFIRAMTFEPFPPASFYIGNKKMVIRDSKFRDL